MCQPCIYEISVYLWVKKNENKQSAQVMKTIHPEVKNENENSSRITP